MMFDEKIRRAKELRTLAEFNVVSLTDEQAVKVKSLYPEWEEGITYLGEDQSEEPISKVRDLLTPDVLYKCRQGHTSQKGWNPSLTPAMWKAIDETHEGTIDDPIPAVRGMEYETGKYYLDPTDNNIYKCTRGAILQYLPHELVLHNFELAEV